MADITLADFWSIDKSLDADLGTSMVIVNNARGEALLQESKERLFITQRTLEEAVNGNAMLNTSIWISKQSSMFLSSLDELRFDKAYSQITKLQDELIKQAAVNKKVREEKEKKEKAHQKEIDDFIKEREIPQNKGKLVATVATIKAKATRYKFLFEELVKRDFKSKSKPPAELVVCTTPSRRKDRQRLKTH